MPASIIRAAVGSMPKVTGMSSAMPAEGPMPGRWLIMVPMNTPISVYSKWAGSNATLRPCRMPCTLSSMSGSEHALRQRHLQEAGEDRIGDQREADRTGGIDQPAAAVEAGQQHEHVDQGGDEVAERLESEIVDRRTPHATGRAHVE